MNKSLLEQIAEAVLYEGYILYPYRATSKKNARERFTFGRVYPAAYNDAQEGAEACAFQTECLLKSTGSAPQLQVEARFLQPMVREIGVNAMSAGCDEPAFTTLPQLRVGDEVFHPWIEAVDRRISSQQLLLQQGKEVQLVYPFSFPRTRKLQPIDHAQNVSGAVLVREQHEIRGELELKIQSLTNALFKITARISNRTPIDAQDLPQSDLILMRTFASTHITLCATAGQFISPVDPPAEFQDYARKCRNSGLWPVLVGDESNGECDMMLASPIILSDYPKIAPESAGPLFDGTEIDEILTLRILTLTEDEKREMRSVDAQARTLLERTESLSASEILRLHGTQRDQASLDEQIFGSNTRLREVSWQNRTLKSGDRVRICPKGRADVMDLALAGRTAVVESVEQDAEQRIHLALVLDDDPGKDFGLDRQTGHRFFFGLDEVEAIA